MNDKDRPASAEYRRGEPELNAREMRVKAWVTAAIWAAIAWAMVGCATPPAPPTALVPVDASPRVEMPTCVQVPAPPEGATPSEILRAAEARMIAQAACVESLREALRPFTR
jgi:hypothetical protein